MIYEDRLKRYKKIRKYKKLGLTHKKIASIFSVSHQRMTQIIKSGTPKRRVSKYKGIYSGMLNNLEGRERTRLIVRIRDKFTCQDCKEVRTPKQARLKGVRMFDVHHLNGLCGKKSKGYDKVSETEGLITLCHRCHFNRHDWQPRIKVRLTKSKKYYA